MQAEKDKDLDFHVIIPARYGSSRLPGKPLRALLGKPLIQWVVENAQGVGAKSVIVATDDERIKSVVEGFGGDVAMTDPDHPSGTDRLFEVMQQRGFGEDSVLVNVQGDEPGLPPELVRQVAQALVREPRAGMSTLATPIHAPAEVFDPNVVKVVTDADGLALYFSRAPIPFVRDGFDASASSMPKGVSFLRHIGLYGYRAKTLAQVANAAPVAIEEAEKLEQLRALSLGVRIHVGVVEEAPAHGVDTEADVAKAEAWLSKR